MYDIIAFFLFIIQLIQILFPLSLPNSAPIIMRSNSLIILAILIVCLAVFSNVSANDLDGAAGVSLVTTTKLVTKTVAKPATTTKVEPYEEDEEEEEEGENGSKGKDIEIKQKAKRIIYRIRYDPKYIYKFPKNKKPKFITKTKTKTITVCPSVTPPIVSPTPTDASSTTYYTPE